MRFHPLISTTTIFALLFGVSACGTAPPVPTLTPTTSHTSTVTTTPPSQPSPTATLPPIPTIAIHTQSAIAMVSHCRQIVDGLYNLKKDLGLPEHLMSENPRRQPSDFDPNQYFQVLTHLKIAPGYQLDYVYIRDALGGFPMLYARKTNSPPFQSYAELLESLGETPASERSHNQLPHKYDYLKRIQIDKTPESYLEFVTLVLVGDQFYRWWHGLYNDQKILCDSSDIQYVNADLQNFGIEFPQEVKDKIEKIDFRPLVVVRENEVTVRLVTFTKWGGFFETVYIMNKDDPAQAFNVQFNPLIEYDCGIRF